MNLQTDCCESFKNVPINDFLDYVFLECQWEANQVTILPLEKSYEEICDLNYRDMSPKFLLSCLM